MSAPLDLQDIEDPRVRFHLWYRSVLEKMFDDQNAGFAILMITLPLLERYSFGKTGGRADGKLGEPEKKVIMGLFPEIKYLSQVGLLWKAYRHGLLHQVTLFSGQKPVGWVNHDIPNALEIDGKRMVIHPAKFAQRVLEVIENDFETFCGKDQIGNLEKLPVVRKMESPSGSPAYLKPPISSMGTCVPPRCKQGLLEAREESEP